MSEIEIQIKEGEKYRLEFSGSHGEKLCHIDYILDSKCYQKEIGSKIIVFRWWSRNRKVWVHECLLYYVLAIWNKWEYQEAEIENSK